PNGTYGATYLELITVNGGGKSNSYASNSGSGAVNAAGYTYSVSSGELPDGLVLNARSGLISGQPTKLGTFSFAITATDGTASASQSYSVSVTALALSIDTAALPNGSTNVPYSQALAISGGAGSYACEITAGALPEGLTLDADTCTIGGKPTTSGSYGFTVTVTDGAGLTVSQPYSLTIDAVTLVIGPDELANGWIGQNYSQTLAASGGQGPYLYTLTGALPDGLSLGPTSGVIAGTPTTRGSFTFTVRVEDANGNVGTRTYTLAIDLRPDPSSDAEVGGKIDAQFEAVRRYGEGQTSNLMGHLQGVHGAFQCGFRSDVTLNGGMASQERNRLDANGSASNSVTLNKEGRACDEELPQLGYWLTGSFDRVDDASENFTSDGLTAGVDVKVSPKLLLGAAVGYGWDSVEVGRNGTSNDSSATSLMAYLSYNPTGRVFVDAMVGYGSVSIDGRRYVSSESLVVSDSRDGSLLFGSVSLGMEHRARESLLIAGYLRYDYVAGDLDGYAERGTTPFALTYASSSQTTGSTVLGGRLTYDLEQSWGRLTPMLRTEWRHRFLGSYDQTLWYSDSPGTKYSLSRASAADDVFSVSAGVEAQVDAMTLGLELGTSGLSRESLAGSSLRATVSYGF
ncbi:MAG: putative Ig domain-containing protein, partial [Steroidobacteraceae bacterium]